MRKIVFVISAILLSANILPAQAESEELTCTNSDCHGEIMQLENIHPILEDGCESCHETNENPHPAGDGNEFTLTVEMPELCFECHDEPEASMKLHVPFSDGDCLTCHSPHSSKQENLLVYEENSICTECHDLENEDNQIIHAPVESSQCNDCHTHHYSANKALLIKESPELCFECHEDQKEQLSMSSVHPVFDGDCFDCHKPHNSTNKALLKEKTPYLCLDCHEDFKEELLKSGTVHSPLKNNGECLVCHVHHAGENEKILVNSIEKLCFKCHDTEIGKKKKLSSYKCIHDPALEGGCNSCHVPHYSDIKNLLTLSYPSKNYMKWEADSYSLCFKCHDPEMIEIRKSTDITEFRNGDMNLHYLHVNKDKGRTCNTCHTIHGSNTPHLLAAKVQFGKWEMPLIYKNTEDGGSCNTACHKELTYKR